MTQPAMPPQIEEEPAAQPSLTALEVAFAAAVLAALTVWLSAVKSAVLAPFVRWGLAPDPEAVGSRVLEWKNSVDALMPDLLEIARLGWLQANQDLGLRIPFKPGDPIIQEQLSRTRNLLVRISDEVYKEITEALNASVARGEDPVGQARAVERVLDRTGSENWPARARTIAITECLHGSTLVNGAHIRAAYRRWYEGDLVTIVTKEGNEFSGTPNHPMLTTRGWVGLGDLLEGDSLVCDGGAVNYAVMPLHPDVEAAPASIAEIFEAVKAVGVVGRIAGREPDFHGDGLDGDVDVTCPHGLLTYGNFTEITESRMDVSLEHPALAHAFLAAQGSPFSYDHIVADKAMTSGSKFDAGSDEDALDGVSGASQLISDLPHRLAEAVLLNYVAGGQAVRDKVGSDAETLSVRFAENLVDAACLDSEAFGDDADAHTFPVVLDDVVSKTSRPFKGHVYNLSTEHGYFAAQGLFTGNTNRAFNFGVLAHGLTASQRMRITVTKTWDSKEDSRVRHAHVVADGQTVGVNEPFIVGGEALMAPGDPSGSPHLVINCRCRSRLRRAS
jgi:hypothetical protein